MQTTLKLSELQSYFSEELAAVYPKTEVRSFFNWLVESYLNWNTTHILLKADEEISTEKLNLFELAIADLKKHKPIQYIVGETEFYGLPFKVNKSVLIPRPETEELVDWVLQDFKATKKQTKLVEIGTGSGCISISLAKHNSRFKIDAYDVSAEALAVAEKNAKLNQVEVQFLEQDVLALDALPNPTEVIVSNPPYVKQDERHSIKANVLDYEPHLALFVEDNSALVFYHKIIALALAQPKVPRVYVEVNQALGEETKKIFTDAGFKDVTLKKDIFHNPRMIRAIF